MISLNVDEAYAFDYLSILELKKDNSSEDKLNFVCCKYAIKNQIDEQLFDKIISSQEYKNLLNTNSLVYNLIEEIRIGKSIDAKTIDDANMLRYTYKKSLQKTYFKSELIEKKT